MILHELPYRIGKEKFLEDISFSIHKYIHYLPFNLDQARDVINNNQNSLNEKDLFGKYNSLNFLLESYLFYQNQRFDDYPKRQDPYIDFLLIFSYLKEYGALETIPDWKRKTFLDNILEIIDTKNWHKSFLPKNIENFINLTIKEQNEFIYGEIKQKLITNSLSNIYQFIFLNNDIKKEKKIKLIQKI